MQREFVRLGASCFEGARTLILARAVNPKRHHELKELFKDSRAGFVFVTAFLDRKTMAKYLGDIAWETEVWVAEAPSHLIHFNGERFLGPYAAGDSGIGAEG